MKIFLLTSLWLAMHSSIFCQKQNNIWCFGQNAGIDFNSDPPSPLTSKMVAINESASIADPFGQLLFYSNGIKVWDRNNNIMPNGMNLMGGKFSYQPVIIVPFPGSKYQYYIFTTQDNTTAGGLRYSIIDMRLNGGLGDIVPGTKNILLIDKTCDKLTSVLHSNGKDIWVITHRLNSTDFYAYLITNSGLSLNPIISSLGSLYSIDEFGGPLKVSPSGTRLVSCSLNDIVELYDFNPSNGQLSNYVNLSNLFNEGQQTFDGAEFSPNDSILYLTSFIEGSFIGYLYQIMINTLELNVLNISDVYFGSLQLGPDGKIYKVNPGSNSLALIRFPNQYGDSAQFESYGEFLLEGTTCNSGLPQQVPYSFLLDSSYQANLGSDTTLCLGQNLLLSPKFPMNCDSTIYLWSDGSSSSELVVNQSGYFWVEIKSDCGYFSDTIKVTFSNCVPIVYYDLENCKSNMQDGSNMSYAEFTPAFPSQLNCCELTASNISRGSIGNKHSCTPGANQSIAMCIDATPSCVFALDDPLSLKFEITIIPSVDTSVSISSIEFYERAPLEYDWINGNSGLNNYPAKFGFRIIKDGTEIFRGEDILTSPEWTLRSFKFVDSTEFTVSESSQFVFEWLPYCPIGNGATVSAWDIDEIKIFGDCLRHEAKPIILGEVHTINEKSIPGVKIELSQSSDLIVSDSTLTLWNGQYEFDSLQLNHSYFLRGFKNDDLLNGVNTLDLICIQRHLLGIDPFRRMDQYIAADINHDSHISVLDLIQLQKLILGKIKQFQNNTSWRFCSDKTDWTDLNLEDFNEEVYLELLPSDTNVVNFVGIKIGDLNHED